MTATGTDYATAAATLAEADGHVKTALVMLLTGATPDEARARIEQAGGFVRQAIEAAEPAVPERDEDATG